MRSVIVVTLCAFLTPSLAWAEPSITAIETEASEDEVRLVVTVDPPTPTAATRLMRDDRSLRLRFADAISTEHESELEDETLRRFRVVTYRGRVILRVDPSSASAVDLLERAEVQPHPRGLALVIQRSDTEVSRYRANHAAGPLPAATGRALAEASGATEPPVAASAEPEAAEPTPGAEPAARRTAPQRAERSSRTEQRVQGASSPSASAPSTWATARASLAVGLVLLLGGVAWFYRRRRGVAPGGLLRSIDVVAAKRIGPRQSLLLVEVCGRTLLVGATEKGMTRLAMIDDHSLALGAEEADRPLEADEELAPPRKSSTGRALTPLERELRRTLGEPDGSSSPFQQELRGAVQPKPKSNADLASILAVQAAALRGRAFRSQSVDAVAPDAVEGLLRLRQMVDDEPLAPPQPVNGKLNGKARANGSDLSLAALESLLTARSPN